MVIMKYCEKCSLQFKEDYNFCPYCGRPLINKDKKESYEDKMKKQAEDITVLNTMGLL